MSDSEVKAYQHIPEMGKLRAKLAVSKDHLDKKEIKRALEEVMTMGHLANEFFSDRAPWASYKIDPHVAAKTISETAAMILVTAAALKPFTPNLSDEIFALFGEVSEEQKAKLYQEEFDVILEIFENAGRTPVKAPKALVPKIDDDVISDLKEKLKTLNS